MPVILVRGTSISQGLLHSTSYVTLLALPPIPPIPQNAGKLALSPLCVCIPCVLCARHVNKLFIIYYLGTLLFEV